jgi:hypothetical protein
VKGVMQQTMEKTWIAMQEMMNDTIDDLVAALSPGRSSNLTPDRGNKKFEDGSLHHNIACTAHHVSSAAWFFKDSVFNTWKSTSSLL